ncbi:sorting nexin-19-like [Saccoglossus kowalevskii]|uniref:Sorting nexin-19-like n=1 Tax=Saccoglossus kowalevskii TaxID=10224 RepID=A0ABM0H124_SACKO|nr:PREDICTED: sorting nexin-19-like [Saccoglossus kowalevskii]
MEKKRENSAETFVTWIENHSVLEKAAILSGLVVLVSVLVGWITLFIVFVGVLLLGGWAAQSVITSNQIWQSDKVLDLFKVFENGTQTILKSDATYTSGSERSINSELKQFVQNIMHDFILAWYVELSDNDQCTSELFSHLEDISVDITNRLSKVSQHAIAEQCLRQFHKHYHDYNQARTKLGMSLSPANRGSHTTISKHEIVDTYFTVTDEHIAIKNSDFECQYLRSIVKTFMKLVFPKTMYDCRAGRKMLQEIVTCKVILPIVDLLSDPDFINRAVFKILSDGPNPKVKDELDTRISTKGKEKDQCEEGSSGITQDTDLKDNRDLQCSLTMKQQNSNESSVVGGATEISMMCTPEPKNEGKSCNAYMYKLGVGEMSLNLSNHEDMTDGTLQMKSPTRSHSHPASPTMTKITNFPGEARSSPSSPTSRHPQSPDLSPIRKSKVATSPTSHGLKHASSNSSLDTNSPFEDIDVDTLFTNSGKPLMRGQTLDDSFTKLHKRVDSIQQAIYHNLCFPGSEIATEYRSSKEYTLYLIQYETLRSGNSSDSPKYDVHMVKRRYREFLNLHSRLEDNAQLKKHIKDVKEPSRLFTLPVGNMNKEYVEYRRRFLEAYILGLLGKPIIHTSTEIREFLAYECDTHIEFVKKAPEIVPRLDKILVRGVSDFIDTLKTAVVSNTESQESYREIDERAMNESLVEEAEVASRMFAFPQALYHSPVENMMAMYQHEIDYNSDDWYPWQLAGDKVDSGKNSDNLGSLLGPRSQGDGCDVSEPMKEVGLETSEIPLAMLTQCILCETFQHCHNSWLVLDNIQHIMTTITGKLFHRWLEIQVSDLTTPTKWAFYISELREAIWSKKKTKPRTKDEKHEIKQLAHQSLCEFFPSLLKTIVGEDEYRLSLEDALQSLQHERINRNFLFIMLDIAMDMIAPEIRTMKLQHSLLEKK